MWRIIVTSGIQQGRALRLRPGSNRIGRNPDNELQIPDSSISGVHCEIVASNNGLLVRDLGSTNGTFIDGVQIRETIAKPGQILQAGNIEFKLEWTDNLTSGISVAVPELVIAPQASSAVMEDGSLSCANHAEQVASYQCTHCRQGLCQNCVRIMPRITGDVIIFCSLCNSTCETILGANLVPADSKKPGLFRRLTKTLKVQFRKRVDPR